MKGAMKRLVAVAGTVGIMSSAMVVAAPPASAESNPVSLRICPVGWYGVIVGYETPDGEKYITVCVQA